MTNDELNAGANRIKARITACTTVQQIAAVADSERTNVIALSKIEGGKGLAHQIANFKAYRISEIERGDQ